MSEAAPHPEPGGPRRQGQPASGRRGRRRGVEIKPGTVKQARTEARLSLGQVARQDLSRTAIYFVETGKSKPSIETLALIADRTGKPLDYFLAQPLGDQANHALRVAEIERLIATGDFAGAVAAGEGLLSHRLDPAVAAQVRFHVAAAHLRNGSPVLGRREITRARSYFEEVGDLRMTAECIGTEASAAYLMLDPSALAIAEAGLAMCRSLKPVPSSTEARLLSIIGAVHTINHDWERAIESYQDAVAIGNTLQDLRSLSVMYGNLSVAYQEIDQLADAARYAHLALAIYETLNDKLSLARSENNLSLLIFRQGNLTDAFRHANRALALWDEVGVDTGRAHVLMTLCELEFARFDYETASRFAAAAFDVASRSGEVLNTGEATLWLARIAEATGQRDTADATFAEATAILESQGPGERVSRAHALYAEVLEARGDLLGANAQLKQALKKSRPVAVDARAATA